MRKCTTCDKSVHRRCTQAPVGSQAVRCLTCLPSKLRASEKEKEKVKNINIKVGTSSAQKGKTTISKDTPLQRLSTVASRLSLKPTVPPRRSYINTQNSTPNNKNIIKNTNCTCNNVLKDMLESWEQKMQEKFNTLHKKFDNTTSHISNIMIEELNKIKSILQPSPMDVHKPKIQSIHQDHASKTNLKPMDLTTTDVNTSSSHDELTTTSTNLCKYKNYMIHSSLNSNLSNKNKNFNLNNNNNNLNFNYNSSNTNLNNNNNFNNFNNFNNLKENILEFKKYDIPINLSSKNQSINYNTANILNKNRDISLDLNVNKNSNNNFNSENLTHMHKSNSFSTKLGNKYNYRPPHPETTNLRENEANTCSEAFEIYIAGFMPLTIDDDIKGLCYSILQGISPMLSISEIANVKLIQARPIINTRTRDSDPSSQPAESANISGSPALIVQLTTSSRVKQIMLMKKELNYYNTRDIDLTPLNNELAMRVPTVKLIINDVLPTIEYQRFKSLRKHAKNIGFKFIWHKDGKFLARWNNNGQAHFFNTLSDLDIIKSIYNTNISNSINPLTTSTTPTGHRLKQ